MLVLMLYIVKVLNLARIKVIGAKPFGIYIVSRARRSRGGGNVW